MFGIGANELIIILLFGFLIFGPDKMPAMAKTLGKAIAKFRSAQEEMNNVIKNEVYDPTSEDPFKNPLDALSKVEQKVTREDRGESFTERKARYDKQRAAQKAAKEKAEGAAVTTATAATATAATKISDGEKHLKGIAESKAALDRARAAQAAKQAEEARQAEEADAQHDGAPAANVEKVDTTTSAVKKHATPAEDAGNGAAGSVADGEKKPTPDELYGVKPRARKPHVQKVPARKPMAPISTKPAEQTLEEARDSAADANNAADTTPDQGKGA